LVAARLKSAALDSYLVFGLVRDILLALVFKRYLISSTHKPLEIVNSDTP
jgi:tRNA nucleotidyltransferase/poly(A) polymerase